MASLVKRNGKWLSKPFKDPATGKRVTKQFDTEALAIAYEEACAAALAAGSLALPEAVTVTDSRSLRVWGEAWLETEYKFASAHTRDSRKRHLDKLCRDFGDATEVTKVLLKDRARDWVDSHDDHKPASRNSFRSTLNVMSRAAYEQGLLQKPFTLKAEKANNQVERWLTKAEEDRMLARMDPDTRDLCRFVILTGLRQSEALAARAEHIVGNTLRVPERKGNKLGYIPLVDEARELLEKHGHWDKFGKYAGDNLGRKIDTACRRADVPRITFHVLRHTFASRLAQQGAHVLQISKCLGHEDIKTTQRYMHLAPDWGDAVLGLIN